MVDLSILDSYDLSGSLDSPYLFFSKPVPRVTSILSSMLHEDYISNWANSLGFKHKNYKYTLQRSADIGTHAHAAIEYFIKNDKSSYFNTINDLPFDIKQESYSAYDSFLDYWYMLNSTHKVEVLGSELVLICKYFGGTCDFLIRVDDKVYIFDFKTSNHVNYKYILQLTAYKYIIENYLYIPVDGLCILQLSKFNEGYTEYMFDLHNEEIKEMINEAQDFFFELVIAYWKRVLLEPRFKEVLNGFIF